MNQLEHILTAIKSSQINGDTCCYEFQAHRNLRPECPKGNDCPYSDKNECIRYKPLISTEQRFSHLRLYGG